MDKYETLKTLLIHDSVAEYFGEEFVMDSRKRILNEGIKNGKSGLTVVAEVGSFYLKLKKEDLVQFEMTLPTHFDDMNYNGICVYHQGDFDSLSEGQKENLLKHHSVTINLESY